MSLIAGAIRLRICAPGQLVSPASVEGRCQHLEGEHSSGSDSGLDG